MRLSDTDKIAAARPGFRRSLGSVGRAAGGAVGVGLLAGGVAAYMRKNQEGNVDWSRSVDTGTLAAEATYGLTAAAFPKAAGSAFSEMPFMGASNEDVLHWGSQANESWLKSGGKKLGNAFSDKALRAYTVGGIVSGALLGGTVFGDSKKNTVSWAGAAGGAAVFGGLAYAAHLRLGNGILQHAQGIMKQAGLWRDAL